MKWTSGLVKHDKTSVMLETSAYNASNGGKALLMPLSLAL